MPGLFDVGKSALQSYRQSLAVTGQNIANINTEGYKRRQANLEEVSASQGGITSVANQAGLGVRVESIRRAFDQYILDRSRNASSNYESTKALFDKLSELENIILPKDANLGTFINNFFNSLQEIAASPGDIAPRIVAIEKGKALSESFNQTSKIIEDLKKGILEQSKQDITASNVLLNELTNINSQLMSSGQGNGTANSLLDNRDKVIDEISKLIEISTDLDKRGSATLRLGSSGNGPIIIEGEKKSILSVETTFDGMQFFIKKTGKISPTSQILNGSLKGLKDAFTLIENTNKEIDEMAFVFSQQINNQHKQGLDLNNVVGKELFLSSGFEISQNPTNSGNFSAEIKINDINKINAKEVSLSYDEEENLWRAFDETKTQITTGKKNIIFEGYQVNITGSANNGEEIFISPSSNFAKNLKFSITNPESLAASSKKIVFSDDKNISNAKIKIDKIDQEKVTNIPSVEEVFTNSISSISASEFFKTGTVAYIPSNTDEIELVSLGKQPSVSFSLTSNQLANATSLSFSTITPTSQSFQFNISYSSIFQGESSSWPSANEVAKYLNQGVLTTTSNDDGILNSISLTGSGNITLNGSLTSSNTATFNNARRVSISSSGNDSNRYFTISGTDKDGNLQSEILQGSNKDMALSKKFFKTITNISSDGATSGNITIGIKGLRLSDIGGYASGQSGNLTIALSEGTLASTTPQIMSSGTAVSGSIQNRADASKIHVFTREGRHLAGSKLSSNEITELITSSNGFNSFAEYRAENLNAYNEVGYRGSIIERSNKTSDHVINIGGDGSSASALFGSSIIPDSSTEAWKLTIDGTKEIDIPSGSSAGYAAKIINTESSKFGVIATASNRIELTNGGDDGNVVFSLSTKNTDFQKIDARISSTNIKPLADKINLYTEKTGITAHISINKNRIILENVDGTDINIKDFNFDGNNGDTISAKVVDQFSEAVSKTINLGGKIDETNFTMSDSQISNANKLNFAIAENEYSFDISYQSAYGVTGNWTDTADIAKYLNRGILLSGTTKLSDLGMYAEGSYGDLKIRLNEKSFSASEEGLFKNSNILNAGDLTLDGDLTNLGSATFNSGRKLSIKSSGNDSSLSFTIIGTDNSGNALSETISGTNSSKILTNNSFKTITKISTNGASSGNVSIGLESVVPSMDISGATSLLGTVVGEKIINTSKFSGNLKLISPQNFSLKIDNQTLSSSIDNRENNLISQISNKTGDKITLKFNSIEGIDNNGNDKNGLLANASEASYTVSIPNTGTGSNFVGTIKAFNQNDISPSSISKKMIKELRSFAPISAFSGSNSVTNEGSISAVTSLPSAGNIMINGTLASSGKVTLNIPRKISLTSSGNDSSRTFTVTGTNSKGEPLIENLQGGDSETVLTKGNFKTITQILIDGATAGNVSAGISNLPNDGDSVVIKYDDKNYKLTINYQNPVTKFNPEITVSGGEEERVIAYFDKANKLQISAPDGSLSGEQFSIPTDGFVAGNESAAKRFGLKSDNSFATRTLTGREITFSNTSKSLTTTLNGSNITVSITPNGLGGFSLATSNPSVTASFANTNSSTTSKGTGQIILKTNENSGSLFIPRSSDAENFFGFKTSDYSVNFVEKNLEVSSTNDKVVKISTQASSLSDQRIKLSNLPKEDLLIIVSGSGVNRISSKFNFLAEENLDDNKNLTVKVTNVDGDEIELLDKDTGHSIATRSLDSNLTTNAGGYNIIFDSIASKDDKFQIIDNIDGSGDSSNLDAIIRLQSLNEENSNGNFQEIFSGIVSKIGASVKANELKTSSAEALRDATMEYESQFSGVNLDEEAANLIEQQQAYQASARILSTARELFDTLLNSV